MTKVQQKKESIIQAAKARFTHFGFAKVTMEEIAGDIELTKPSLYYYFPTKDDLFKEVIKSEQATFLNGIAVLIKSEITASEKLSIFSSKRLDYFRNLLNAGTMNVHPYIDEGSTYKTVFSDFELKELKLLKKIFNEGKKRLEFDEHLPYNIEYLFLHLLQGLRIRTIKVDKDRIFNESVFKELLKETKTIVEIFTKGIRK